MVARRVRVTGRVQGVAFRAWTKAEADELGIHGWVRNHFDGSVEAHLEGDEGRVEDLVGRMWHGPALARVDALVTEPAGDQNLEGFQVRH